MSLNEVDVEMSHKYVLEMDFKLSKDPCISKFYSDPLVPDTNSEEIEIKSEVVKEREEDLSINSENIEISELRALSFDTCLKFEEIIIKPEVHDREGEEMINIDSNEVKFEEDDIGRFQPSPDLNGLNKEVHSYKCDLCDFNSTQKAVLMTHLTVHKDPLEIQWYKCALCDYKSIQRYIMKRHMIRHKAPSEVKWYLCKLCAYKSKFKAAVKRHLLLTHGNSYETQWYNCDSCSYKSKLKTNWKRHLLTHVDPSDIQWFKCDLCDYKSKRRYVMETHMKRHNEVL